MGGGPGSGKGGGEGAAAAGTQLREAQRYIEMNLSSMIRAGDKQERAHKTREGYKDKMKQDVFFLMDEHCSALQIANIVRERAKELFAGYRDMLEQLQKKEAVEAACLLAA